MCLCYNILTNILKTRVVWFNFIIFINFCVFCVLGVYLDFPLSCVGRGVLGFMGMRYRKTRSNFCPFSHF